MRIESRREEKRVRKGKNEVYHWVYVLLLLVVGVLLKSYL
jgi:hypothetical protein